MSKLAITLKSWLFRPNRGLARLSRAVAQVRVGKTLMSDDSFSAAFDSRPGGGAHDESRYAVVRELGHGACGAVFLVRDRETGEHLALKKLYRVDGRSVMRLKREFRALAGMNHPNLIKLFALERAQDAWSLVMEFVDGPNLDAFLGHDTDEEDSFARPIAAPVTLEVICDVFYQIACGLQALHHAGLLHRDLKPSNVVVEGQRAVVLDFGLVRDLSEDATRLTEDGMLTGTPAYMAPEQTVGQALTAASDWYAFGVMLYQALSGELPISGTIMELLARKRFHDPAPVEELVPNLPAPLSALCMQLLKRDPAARPTGHDVLNALRAFAPARTERTGEQPSPPIAAVAAQQAEGSLSLFGRDRELAALDAAYACTAHAKLVVVNVHGASGAGKSSLIAQFLDRAARNDPSGQMLILRGRCYEQESMPFKALDGVMDAVARHLASLDDLAVAHLLPTEINLLSLLFPVLGRLRAVQRLASHSAPGGESIYCRHSAERGLRELFSRMAARTPVVIWIDDLQWGDLDSAAILKRWLELPLEDPLMLVLSYRGAESNTSPCLKIIQQAIEHAPTDSVIRSLEVRALDDDAIRALSQARLPGVSRSHPELLDLIVREARGNPLLACQLSALAQTKRARGDTDLHTISVDGLVAQTRALLPQDARNVLSILAIAGRPISPKLALSAAGVRKDQHAVLHALRGLDLIRSRDYDDDRLIELYHDRVRESVRGSLSLDASRHLHDSLLVVLERAGHPDVGWLHSLALVADQREQALRYGLFAADRARSAFAFERASELYEVCLTLTDASSMDSGEIWLKFATTLAQCGRGARAAEAYAQAANHASGDNAIAILRMSVSHLVRSGRFKESEAPLSQVLRAMRLTVPESEGSLKLAIVWEHARLSLRGRSFKPRDAQDIAASRLARIDMCDSLGVELLSFDVLRAALFQARGQRWAFESGEPRRVGGALCAAASNIAMRGGPKAEAKVNDLIQRAEAMARELKSDELLLRARGTRAICGYLLGLPEQVIAASDEVEAMLASKGQPELDDAYYRHFAVVSARIGSLLQRGDGARFFAEQRNAVQKAQATDNTHALLMLGLTQTYADEMTGKLMEGATRLLEEQRLLPEGAFGMLHCLHMTAMMRVASGHDDPNWGAGAIEQAWERFQTSVIRRSAMLAANAHDTHARWVLNRHVRTNAITDPADGVKRDIRMLSKLHIASCRPAVWRIEARLACLKGDIPRAIELLRRCAAEYDGARWRQYAASTLLALSELVTGEEAQTLKAQGTEQLRACGVSVNIADFTRVYYPELLRAPKQLTAGASTQLEPSHAQK